jgi:hypothetical protein
MRCAVGSLQITAAGLVFNFLLAALCAVILLLRKRKDTLSYFLWLCCAFNVLRAFGYMIVGGGTTFGDWGVLFGQVNPQWLWRTALVIVGLAGYMTALAGLGRLYRAIAGIEGFRPIGLRH